MVHLLHLDSSPRSFSTTGSNQSVTRMLTQEFVTVWKTEHSDKTIFGFIGITDVKFIHCDRLNPITSDEATRTQSITEARTAIKEVAVSSL